MRTMIESKRPELFRPEFFRKNETGSLTIFGLFIFILLLMMSGMAVDLVRQERARVAIQNTIDTAVVAASSLTQEAQSKAEVEALVKSYMEKAGFDPEMVTVDSDLQQPAGSDEIISRYVNASVNFEMDTMFMNMLGIDALQGNAASGAREGNERIEIALVLDTSGSMNGTKMTNLKTAAKSFITTVLTNNGPNRTLISIIPYSQQVHMNDDLMARLNLNTDAVDIETPDPYTNAMQTYVPGNTATNCARFRTDDYTSHRLVDGGDVELLSHFAKDSTGNYSAPSSWNRWCRKGHKAEVMLFQNDITTLHGHIDSMTASGWTAVDIGMNWGVGVLDDSFQNVVSGMVTDNLAPGTALGFPVQLGTPDVKKYVVLMTDGINTHQYDLKDTFKSGPSRIWYSADLAAGTETDGFLVGMPDAAASQRWYRPRSPWTTGDDEYLHANEVESGGLAEDAVQWDHHALFNRFHYGEAADYFFSNVDAAAYNAYSNASLNDGWGEADTALRSICATARENNWITIFTVAFEAPTAANNILDECSGRDEPNYPGAHFDVSGNQLQGAFDSIAAEITKLRLTQ